MLWSLLGELVGAVQQGAAMEPDHHGGQGLWAVQAVILGAVDVEKKAVLLQAAAHPSWRNETSKTRRGSSILVTTLGDDGSSYKDESLSVSGVTYL